MITPEERVSNTKQVADPDDRIELLAGENAPFTALVTNKVVPPCWK
jgi:hypothetical protein